jgi:hypothetical protein
MNKMWPCLSRLSLCRRTKCVLAHVQSRDRFDSRDNRTEKERIAFWTTANDENVAALLLSFDGQEVWLVHAVSISPFALSREHHPTCRCSGVQGLGTRFRYLFQSQVLTALIFQSAPTLATLPRVLAAGSGISRNNAHTTAEITQSAARPYRPPE